MKPKYQKVRGTRDIFSEELALYQRVVKVTSDIFSEYGYKEIRLPTFEDASLFIHTTGETTDIVQKEMYVFPDKKGRMLALRPEGTPQVIRAYLENELEKIFPVSKFYYSGNMFRYERPQEDRFREFYQIGCEYFKCAHPVADAEIILLMKDIYDRLGINDLQIQLNSLGCITCRNNYRQKLVEFLENQKKELCDDCKTRLRTNPLRSLDCKVDKEKLIKNGVPKLNEFLCDDCTEHFKLVCDLLERANLTFELNPFIVRGLDYYTRTVFEAKTATSDVLAAGGRYDYLIKQLGGTDTPAVGFAIGVDRTAKLIKKDRETTTIKEIVFIIVQPQQKIITESFVLIQKLHTEKIHVIGPFPDKSLKAQMRFANSIGARFVIILGENEIRTNSYTLRDMINKTQEQILFNNLIAKIKKI